jgi:3',5'-cyclic-AMP phosphodiesterase
VSAFRVIQISDSHLSREKPWFVPNFEAMVGIVAAERPDLVINTGDISFDGAEREDDLAFARACHAAVDVALRAVPGNHDLGDNPWRSEIAAPITDERRSRYRRHFGEDFWLVDAGPWVIVGVNAQLLGSGGLAAEDEQWAFLADVPARAGARPVALFTHKPLFDLDPSAADVNQRYVTPESRRRVLDVLQDADLALIASGHVHQHRRYRVGDVDCCWAPSTAFVLPERRQPSVGVKRVGYVDYVFRPARRVDVTVVEAPQLTNHNLEEFVAV